MRIEKPEGRNSLAHQYVENQEAHHAKMSFEKEFIALLDRHGVSYDPKSIFE